MTLRDEIAQTLPNIFEWSNPAMGEALRYEWADALIAGPLAPLLASDARHLDNDNRKD